jgi:hypothetical protein
MTWYSRTWVACGWRGCEAEALRNRAEELGWKLRDGQRALCPVHRDDVREPDAAERAAGEGER